MSSLDAAEAQLEALRSAISSLESGGAASRDDVLRDLKALRVSVAADSEKVAATAAERDRVAGQVKELTEGNAKLRYQIAQLQRAHGDAGAPGAAAPAAAAAAAPAPAPAPAPAAAGGTAMIEGPDGASFPATDKLYFEEMQRCECEAAVLCVGSVEEKGATKTVVVLDQTVMHPQGGGRASPRPPAPPLPRPATRSLTICRRTEPTDVGTLTCGDSVFTVEMVRAVGGNLDSLIYHYGSFAGAPFATDAKVQVAVEPTNRQLCARLHSAGHLVDDAMKLCGDELAASLKPTKGYHFKDGPYVEYSGAVPAPQREPLARLLEETLNRLIAEGSTVRVVQAAYEEIPKLCGEAFCDGPLMALIPKDRKTRVVIVKDIGCPCGGTHVADIAEIGKITISKIKVKKGKTSVCYRLA